MCMYGTCVNKPGGYECICDEQQHLIPSGTGCVGLYCSLSVCVCLSVCLCVCVSTCEHSVAVILNTEKTDDARH